MNKLEQFLLSLPINVTEHQKTGYDLMLIHIENEKKNIKKQYDEILKKYNQVEENYIKNYNDNIDFYLNTIGTFLKNHENELHSGKKITNTIELYEKFEMNEWAKNDFIKKFIEYGYTVEMKYECIHHYAEKNQGRYEYLFTYEIIKIF